MIVGVYFNPESTQLTKHSGINTKITTNGQLFRAAALTQGALYLCTGTTPFLSGAPGNDHTESLIMSFMKRSVKQ